MLSSQLSQQPSLPPPSSLQSALQMDPNQHIQLQQQQQQQQQQQATAAQTTQPTTGTKRRKKTDANGEEIQSTSEPRRLRRSHEACARCRSKKIKCDSKHPRCTACATAGTACHQEDRHRQTLTPRGHTERVEQQVAQCEALLKRHIPGFDLEKLDEILAREGIDIGSLNPAPPTPSFQFQQTSTSSAFRTGQPPQSLPPQQPGMYYPPPPHMMPPPGYMIPPYGPPFHPMPMQGPPGAYNPHLPPQFQPPPPGYMGPPMHPPPQQQPPPQQGQQQPSPTPLPTPTLSSSTRGEASKGQDPNGNDMSNTEALAKNFGVSAAIVNDLKLSPGHIDKEDLAVGSSGLTSGRDRDVNESTAPRDAAKWVTVTVRRNSTTGVPNTLSISGLSATGPSVEVWLPKDRKMVQHIVEGYFTRLNVHRPVFVRKDFDKTLNDLYDKLTVSHDPGYVCSVYLVLALGTLSELNHRAVKAEMENQGDVFGYLGSSVAKKLMPPDWPEHDEFFERALSVKPDLRVTISSLQALILLHWYLYTERQGRTLWRLVGSLVRLAVELGLHHDPTTQVNPTTQQKIFSEEECQLRIRLWGIVLVHDRGTSILLGRPLAISPSDFNTPPPSRSEHAQIMGFSEHFEHSHPVAEIQADIINSLYTPKRHDADMLMQNATRIIKRLTDLRQVLPERYKFYFTGTSAWPLEKKTKLVQGITEDEGLTLLKIGIARILLLRALFSSKELSYDQRHRALVDAIITSHNTIIVHNHLIRFPDIAFFTSPIPLHIAAMVILYGHMSKCDVLPKHTALEDVWLALDTLPRFRWRWERKDVNGGHPLIAKLAERVMEVNLQQVVPSSPPYLICEPEWEDENNLSPVPKSQQTTPTLSSASYSGGGSNVTSGSAYGPHPRSMSGATGSSSGANGNGNSAGSTSPDNHLVEVPTQLFYPFYPETQVFSMPATTNGTSGNQRDYSGLLAAAAAAQDGSHGCQSSHDSFVLEERDPSHSQHPQQNMVWMNVQGQRSLTSYPVTQS